MPGVVWTRTTTGTTLRQESKEMRLNDTLGPCTPNNESRFAGKRFRPTMTWAQYFDELNKLCDELNAIDEALATLKKQPKEKNEPSKR